MGKLKTYFRVFVLTIFLLLVYEGHLIFKKSKRYVRDGKLHCDNKVSSCKHSNGAVNSSLTLESQSLLSNKQCFKLIWNNDKGYIPKHGHVLASGIGTYTVPCRRYAELKSFKGSRLGNQMFQTAALIGTAYDHDLYPILRKRLVVSKYFDLPNKSGKIHLDIKKVCTPALPGVYEPCNKSRGSLVLHGYFQSFKYFQNISDIIRKVFTFKDKYMNPAKTFLDMHSKRDFENICVHVRRGDMTWSYHRNRGLATAGVDFIENAMKYYKNIYTKIVFIFVSDDIPWCKANINESVVFSPFQDPGSDLALLSLCDHVVVTSGTFGWWGAWLSRGTTVYFKGYPRPGSRQDSRMKRSDYYPSNWIGM